MQNPEQEYGAMESTGPGGLQPMSIEQQDYKPAEPAIQDIVVIPVPSLLPSESPCPESMLAQLHRTSRQDPVVIPIASPSPASTQMEPAPMQMCTVPQETIVVPLASCTPAPPVPPPWRAVSDEPNGKRCRREALMRVKLEEEAPDSKPSDVASNAGTDCDLAKPDESMLADYEECNAKLTNAVLLIFKLPVADILKYLAASPSEAGRKVHAILTSSQARTCGCGFYRELYNTVFNEPNGKKMALALALPLPESIESYATVDLKSHGLDNGLAEITDICTWYKLCGSEYVAKPLEPDEALSYYGAALKVIMTEPSGGDVFLANYKQLAEAIPERFRLAALVKGHRGREDVTHGIGRSWEVSLGGCVTPCTPEATEICRSHVRLFVEGKLRIKLGGEDVHALLTGWLMAPPSVILDDRVAWDVLRRAPDADCDQYLSLLACRKGACTEILRERGAEALAELWPGQGV